MATFEEDQVTIANLRAKLLGQALTPAQADAAINDYFSNDVTAAQTKVLSQEKAQGASEDATVATYFDNTVAAERSKLVGNNQT